MSRKTATAGQNGVPGNTIEEQRLFDEMVYGTGRAWLSLVSELSRLDQEGTVMKRVVMKGRWVTGGHMMIVLTADMEEGPMVAFHQVDEVRTLPQGLEQRLKKGKLKWREDEYA